MNPLDVRVILFCGLPGTLKTYLARRLAMGLGYAYLPTRAAGQLLPRENATQLETARNRRYEGVARIVASLSKMNVRLVVDGEFLQREARKLVLSEEDPATCLVVHCFCDDEAIRRRRLVLRACDSDDPERESARSILELGELHGPMENPLTDLAEGSTHAVLSVDTHTALLQWHGTVGEGPRQSVVRHLTNSLRQHRASPLPASYLAEVGAAFDKLSTVYDDTTPWRGDEVLLRQLRMELPRPNSRVLDVGAGTGLASFWYAERGHQVVGLDPSPRMLMRAAERLTLTVLGAAPPLPFPDEYFDLILSRQSLHYSEPSLVLEEVRRCLRSEGRLVVSNIVADTECALGFWRDYKLATQPLRLDVYTEDRLVQLLVDAGFSVDRVLRHRLRRTETVSELNGRVPTPRAGWSTFLERMVDLAAVAAPGAELRFDGENLEYSQHWCTLWAR